VKKKKMDEAQSSLQKFFPFVKKNFAETH